MKMYLLYGLVATVLFGLAATVSLMFLSPPPKPTDPAKPAATAKGEHEPAGKSAEGGSMSSSGEKIRPVVKTPQSAEEVAQLLQSVRQRETAVKEKEEHQAERQHVVEMVLQDVKSERASLDDLRKGIATEMDALQKEREELNRAKELEEQKKSNTSREADQRKKDGMPDMNDPAYIKKQALVVESMSPEGAARFIEQLATTNKLDIAGKILGQMRESKAAKVLDSVSDPYLATTLAERIRPTKAPAPANPINSAGPPPQ